jgi:hypothetical protein
MTDTAPKKSKPTLRQRANEAVCPECGGAVVRRSARGPMPTFCSAECKKERGNRRLVRGSAVIELLQAWRVDRGTGEIAQAAFQQLCQIADQFNAEDNEFRGPNGERRQRADLMGAKILDMGMFHDRQHAVNLRRGLENTAATAEKRAAAA